MSSSELVDLPPPKITTKDKFEQWELTQPWVRCNMLAYRVHLDLAHEDCGGEGFVTRAALARQFNTPVWSGLKNADSKLSKFLVEWMCDDDDKSKLSYESLAIFGILHCKDKKNKKEKAISLYNLLQDGGVEKNPQISAQDKDFEPVTNKLFRFAAIDIVAMSGN